MELGESEDRILARSAKIANARAFVPLWHDGWSEVLADWRLDDLTKLIKGFVLLESERDEFNHGSVPIVAPIFRIYERSAPKEQSDQLADWVLMNTNNDWSPYGTSNHGARSLLALRQWETRIAKKATEIAMRESEREAAGKEKRRAEATLRLPNSLKRKDRGAVRALILKGASPDARINDSPTAREIAADLGIEDWLNVDQQC